MSRVYEIADDDLEIDDKELLYKTNNLGLFLENLPNSREKSIALTKLEECFMWAVVATRNEE